MENNFDVANYWETRYKNGNDSGWGSHDIKSVSFKADFVNGVIKKYNVKTVCELGCGDGNQLKEFTGYEKYYGYDISETIIKKTRSIYVNDDSKIFYEQMNDVLKNKYDLVLSLDVIYHLVNDSIFHEYMSNLFLLSSMVCLFTTNHDFYNNVNPSHIRNRNVSKYVNDVKPEFKLIDSLRFYEESENDIGFLLYKKEL